VIDGYLRLERAWSDGERVELELPMAPRLMEAHPYIESTRGCLAIERGPLVYCLEQADQASASVPNLEIDPSAKLEAEFRGELLDGVTVVRGAGFAVDTAGWSDRLYRPFGTASEATRRPVELTAIPYFAWANREVGPMRVWIPFREAEATRTSG
jgi:DUF1680 family protein